MNLASDDFFRTAEISHVTLRVRDLARVERFYREAIGLVSWEAGDGAIELSSAPGALPMLRLQHAPEAAPRREGEAGLFHTAFLFPDRGSLAQAARRLTRLGIPFAASDHGVSEALYLADPEGNGIELYADRPAGDWPPASGDGSVSMYTRRLDVAALLAAEAETAAEIIPEGTRVGHIHLSVSDLARAEALYHGVIGFRIRQRDYPGALFLGLDGYHHHLAVNTWRSSRPAAPGSAGLASFALTFHDRQAFDETKARVASASPGQAKDGGRAPLGDADGWTIELRVSDS